jgi:hypothetical protein
VRQCQASLTSGQPRGRGLRRDAHRVTAQPTLGAPVADQTDDHEQGSDDDERPRADADQVRSRKVRRDVGRSEPLGRAPTRRRPAAHAPVADPPGRRRRRRSGVRRPAAGPGAGRLGRRLDEPNARRLAQVGDAKLGGGPSATTQPGGRTTPSLRRTRSRDAPRSNHERAPSPRPTFWLMDFLEGERAAKSRNTLRFPIPIW